MTLNIFPVTYTAPGEEGDLAWMITSGLYPNSVFVFPETLDNYYLFSDTGPANQNARPYNFWGLYGANYTPMSQGIPIASQALGAFSALTSPGVQSVIDLSFMHLGWLIDDAAPENLYFSAVPSGSSDPPKFDDMGLTGLGSDVIGYITDHMYSLGTYTPP